MAHATSSRHRYRTFVQDYRLRRLDDGSGKPAGKPDPPVSAPGRRREYLRDYIRWLRPHRLQVAGVFLLALAGAGLQMVEPLFMRFIIDRVLLNQALDTAARLTLLHLAGGIFLAVIVISNLIGALKDYRQRLLNVRVMLSLRRSLFDRLLHLPLPRLWDMKTGGILSRLTGDVDTTTGLMQMAIVSPSISFIRLLIAIAVLLTLNWRLALMALAIVPGRDGGELRLRAAGAPDLPIGAEGRRADRRPRRRDVLGNPRRPRVRPRSARGRRLHGRAPHGAAQGAVRPPPGNGPLDVVGPAARPRSTS